ncbi:hypothetical protein ASE21_04045 [Flavobacterium sp. Root901]|uniref:hypothetical protein n=1 Tax=Flavobacterium sp. Root901 TaxID=1736605 RepID=UPI00070E35C2|nr:hypothetical protein [Flavobacterium sp. Root901]KRD10901.1 hypothetical protein ASE21_04045 [Flavobacterium sp. Root901]
MLLKNIFLYPDLVEFQNRPEDLSLIRYQTRYIGNYLSRNLAKLKFNAGGFNRVCVVGQSNPEKVYRNSSSAVSVGIHFDIDECLKTGKQYLGDYYSKLYKLGLEECNKVYKLPLSELFFWLDELKNLNYKNEWTFKERTFKKNGLKCKLHCSIDLDKFELRLIVSDKGNEIFNQIILTTPPDEIIFYYKFKDIELINNNIVVINRFHGDNILFQLPLNFYQDK